MDNFYCAAPWRGLHINPQGSVKTCCAGASMLGNLNTQSITEILNGPVLREVRESLQQGKPHAYCNNCVKSEQFGSSERSWHNERSPDFDFTAPDNSYIPVLIDIRWNLTCNLSCNYCDANASSKWASIMKIPVASETRKYYTEVCDFLEQYKDSISEVALVGGEPLLLPENNRLLDVIPEDCQITVITNLTVDLENNKIFKKLATKSKVVWNVSFDNIRQKFEYVRHGAKWETIEKNLKLLRTLRGTGHWESIHSVYNLYNATCLEELVSWGKRLELNFNFQGLHWPAHLNPLFHNKDIRDLASEQLDRLLLRTDLEPDERNFITQTRAMYNDPQEKNLTKEFLDYTTKLENDYHPDQLGQFARLWPEIHNKLNT